MTSAFPLPRSAPVSASIARVSSATILSKSLKSLEAR